MPTHRPAETHRPVILFAELAVVALLALSLTAGLLVLAAWE